MKQYIILVGMVIGALFFFPHCDRLEQDKLRIGINTFPESINPLYSTSETSQAIINKVFDSMYYSDYDGNIRKGLVKSEKVTLNTPGQPNRLPGQMEILIELKENVYFSDGKELESEDVIRTIKVMQDKTFRYYYSSDIEAIQDVLKLDRRRFIIRLRNRLAVWKNLLSFKILNSRELLKATPDNFRNMMLTGTGNYKIMNVKRPVKIALERNGASGTTMSKRPPQPSMWQRIEYVVVSDTYQAPMKMLNSELDICELQPEDAAAYAGNEEWRKNFSLLTYRKFGYTYLVFNLSRPAITLDVRKIFYHVLTDGDFMESFLDGRGKPVHTPILFLNSRIRPKIMSVARLEKPVRISLLLNAESNIRRELANFLKKRLKAFNIELALDFRDYGSLLGLLKEGEYDAAVSGYLLDIDYDVKGVFKSGSRGNYARFNSPAMDKLLKKGLMELDPRARESIYRDVHDLWLKELPLIPLFSLDYHIAVSRRVKIPTETYRLVGAEGDFLFNIREWGKGKDRQ